MERFSHFADNKAQASIEMVSLALLVAASFAVGSYLLGHSKALGNSVVSAINRAICDVSGGSCSQKYSSKACLLKSDSSAQRLGLSIAVVDIGRDSYLLRQQNSDGTVKVTIVDSGKIGVGIGAETSKEAKGGFSLGGAANVAADLSTGWGRSWSFESSDSADQFINRVSKGGKHLRLLESPIRKMGSVFGVGGLPKADTDTFDLANQGSAELAANLKGIELATVEAKAFIKAGSRVRFDRRSRQLEIALKAEGELAGVLESSGIISAHELSNNGNIEAVATLDSRGRLVRSALIYTYVDGGGDLHKKGATLEILDQQSRDTLIAALKSSESVKDRAAELVALLKAEAKLEHQRFGVGTKVNDYGDALKLAGKIGVDYRIDESSHLLKSAREKPPGGVWQERFDCTA